MFKRNFDTIFGFSFIYSSPKIHWKTVQLPNSVQKRHRLRSKVVTDVILTLSINAKSIFHSIIYRTRFSLRMLGF